MAENDTDRVWGLMKKISICMFATWDGHELHARPMGAYVRREDDAIFFLTDVRHHKDEEIKQFPQVNLSFADTGGQKYVSLSGQAEVSNDRAKVGELWGTPARAWWDSPDDPFIRVLKVTPQHAEFWDSPGTTIAYVKMAAAAFTGTRPDMGANRKVGMR